MSIVNTIIVRYIIEKPLPRGGYQEVGRDPGRGERGRHHPPSSSLQYSSLQYMNMILPTPLFPLPPTVIDHKLWAVPHPP